MHWRNIPRATGVQELLVLGFLILQGLAGDLRDGNAGVGVAPGGSGDHARAGECKAGGVSAQTLFRRGGWKLFWGHAGGLIPYCLV